MDPRPPSLIAWSIMPHAVALVPGFLGFGGHDGPSYFPDRFVVALGALIERVCGQIPIIVPLPTSPIGNLAERQRQVLRNLRNFESRRGETQWHLVGHSAGGIDAALLLRTHQLTFAPDTGTVFSTRALTEGLVSRILSVTTIAAPFYGTTLARAPFGRFMSGGGIDVPGLLSFVEAVVAVTQPDAFWSRLAFAVGAITEGRPDRFLTHLLLDNELAHDLDPDTVSALTETRNRRDVPLFSIATIAPPPDAGSRDQLFRALWTWTHDAADHALPRPPTFPDAPPLLRSNNVLPTIDAGSNDGLVNTDRQVDGQLAGLVVADHGDVIGRYRRNDPVDGRVLDPGLMTSEAAFGDAEFIAFLACIAERIGGAITQATSRGIG